MGSAKEHMLDMQTEHMNQWIRKNYDIPDDTELDDNYPEYESMVAMYDHEQERENYEADMLWYEEHPYNEIYNSFRARLRQLQQMITADKNPFVDKMIHQMVYAHSVTLFEAMVGDIIKACARKFPHIMGRLVSGISDTTKDKYSLRDIVRLHGVNGIAMSVLNEQTFHNIKTVNHYVNMISENGLSNQHESAMTQIVLRRHDFVHRNGADKEGNYHAIDSNMIFDAIETISLYSEDIHQAIQTAAEGTDSF